MARQARAKVFFIEYLILQTRDRGGGKYSRRRWVLWVLYNIAPGAGSLPEGAKQLPQGALQGLNDWKRTGYAGPCPPIGRHRYFFKLYALDALLPNLDQLSKTKLEASMKPHVITRAELS